MNSTSLLGWNGVLKCSMSLNYFRENIIFCQIDFLIPQCGNCGNLLWSLFGQNISVKTTHLVLNANFTSSESKIPSFSHCEYYTVENSRFVCHPDFTWNQVWRFSKSKISNLPHLGGKYFDLYEFLHFLKAGIYQNQNSKPLKLQKRHFSYFQIHQN